MTLFSTRSSTLTYDVFALKRSSLTRDIPPGTEALQWVANTATLIAGSQDAILVDTFVAVDQNQQLVEWIKQHGKHLTAIYLTHAHGDHTCFRWLFHPCPFSPVHSCTGIRERETRPTRANVSACPDRQSSLATLAKAPLVVATSRIDP